MRIDEDPTRPVCLHEFTRRTPPERVLLLEEVEAVVKPRHHRVELVFFNPDADPSEPWLWLTIDNRLARVYPAWTALELGAFIDRHFSKGRE